METLILYLNTFPTEITSLLTLVACLATLLTLFRLFGAVGIQLYVCVAILATNIQVLKIVSYSHMSSPVAFGTILFATTFVALDILTEFYGQEYAQRTINLGFAAMLVFTLFMLLTLSVRPLTPEISAALPESLRENHNHMMALFLPAPALFLASIIAYYASEWLDIRIFTHLSAWTQRRLIWLRTSVSGLIATTVDNTIFSVLAWVVLASHPLPWSVVISTYILSTLLMRLGIAILCTPVLYLAKYCRPQREGFGL